MRGSWWRPHDLKCFPCWLCWVNNVYRIPTDMCCLRGKGNPNSDLLSEGERNPEYWISGFCGAHTSCWLISSCTSLTYMDSTWWYRVVRIVNICGLWSVVGTICSGCHGVSWLGNGIHTVLGWHSVHSCGKDGELLSVCFLRQSGRKCCTNCWYLLSP